MKITQFMQICKKVNSLFIFPKSQEGQLQTKTLKYYMKKDKGLYLAPESKKNKLLQML